MTSTPQQKLIKKFQQAQQELNQGDAAKAIYLFEKLLKASNNHPDILYLMSMGYGKLGQMDKVKQVSKRILNAMPNHYGALCNLANVLFTENNMSAAMSAYEKALAIKPGEPSIIDNYCRVLNTLGRQAEAIDILNKLLTKRPDYASAHVVIGIAYAETGQLILAQSSFEKALSINPMLADANLGLGNLCRFKGELTKSEKYYNAVLKIEKRHALAYTGLSTIKRSFGLHDEALEIISTADKLIPNHPTILATKADILEHLGKYDDAFELLKKLKRKNTLPPLGAVSYANMCRQFDACEDALELVKQTIEKPSTNNLEQQMLYFSMGKLLDKSNRYDEAFESYEKANNCVNTVFDKNKALAFVDQSINAFTPVSLKNLPRASNTSSRPIFILGMPRSGTSLTEQILAAHPDVYGAGELGEIESLVNTIKQREPKKQGGYESRLPGISSEVLNECANKYLQSLSSLDKKARFITDKMPHNFKYIGLIALLFPNAKIIHCTRNPLDNILSIYFQYFSSSHAYASNLKNIAHFYNGYNRLMAHWQKVLDIPILTNSYEAMVEDQQTSSRKLLDFCDLEWDDAVLHFHKTKRNVGTASYNQVRQPIYSSSKQRWRYYEKHMEEAKAVLTML